MTEPIRILQVFASLNIGGAECRMMDVYRNLDKEKVQFDFVTLTDGDQFFESEIKQLGGNVFKLKNPRETGIMKHIKDLIRVMKSHEYQAVHAHTSYHCGIVSLAALIVGIKYRVSHARTTGTIQKGIVSQINIIFGKFLIHFFSNKKLSISRDAGIFLYGEKAINIKKVNILPNAINLDEYEKIDAFDKYIESKVNGFQVIGHIGRFSEMKNHKFLIEIFKELTEEKDKYKMILIGDGVLKSDIEARISSKQLTEDVILTGNRRDIPYLLSMIDVLVMPSIYEGLGGVVIEAQAAGVPCVVSNVLPKEIDLQLNLIQRVKLDAPIQDWVNAIKEAQFKRINDREIIRKKFIEKKYTVEQEVDYLLSNIYEIQ